MDSLTEAIDPFRMRAELRVGTTLRDKWRLDVLLGIGGMAAVYAATHRNESRAAIKILHPELSTHSEIRSRFLREGRAANRIGHSGVVRVLDDDVTDDGSVFIVMELLDGESLDARAERKGRVCGAASCVWIWAGIGRRGAICRFIVTRSLQRGDRSADLWEAPLKKKARPCCASRR